MGFDERLNNRVSSDAHDVFVVMRAVLMVFTYLSMKPLDLRHRDDNMLCSMCCLDMNLARSSDEKEVSIDSEDVLRLSILGDRLPLFLLGGTGSLRQGSIYEGRLTETVTDK